MTAEYRILQRYSGAAHVQKRVLGRGWFGREAWSEWELLVDADSVEQAETCIATDKQYGNPWVLKVIQ